MYSLEQIYHQALKDRSSLVSTDKFPCIINYGLKVQRFNSKIEVLNCSYGSGYYREITDKEYGLLLKYGWVDGALRIDINNCHRKLKTIEDRIKNEINSRKNDKYIKGLKKRRETIIKRFTYLKKKLNERKCI